MCGIGGIINTTDRSKPPKKESLESMIKAIRHRGPDEFGIYRDLHAGLVHARLSLIDLAAGQQPMTNEDGTLWIVFNGEIFNYLELKYDLEHLGHRFRTQCDTEVIIHAFEEWGDRCFQKFNGQWSLALWNSKKKELVLSRDRVGVRPLFVYEGNGRILFASEIKALLTDPSVPRQINPQGLDQTFTYWSPIAPTTMFEGIEAIVPGTVRTYFHDGTRKDVQYWHMSFPDMNHETAYRSMKDATEQLREKLFRATELRMLRADVPVGSYLSGGLDSSVVAKMGRMSKEGRFQTFSLRFDDPEFDETPFQRLMASTIESDHTEIVITRSDIARVFPQVIWHTEQPVLRTAPAPLFLLSQRVRDENIKAVLTGEGADEMFVGYDLFREAKIRMFWSHFPDSTCRPALFDRIYPYLIRSPQRSKRLALEFWKQGLEKSGQPAFSHDPRWRTTSALKKFFSNEINSSLEKSPSRDVTRDLPSEFSRWDPLAQAQYLEVSTLLSGYLLSAQGDRMLMAHSVEGRFPFLDSDVIEFSNSLPAGYKLPGLQEKKILKDAARGLVPEKIIERPKQPYRAPDAACFIGHDVLEYVEDTLSKNNVQQSGMFDPVSVSGLYAKCKRRGGSETLSNSDNMAFVGILSAQLLYHQMIDSPPEADRSPLPFKTDIKRSNTGIMETVK